MRKEHAVRDTLLRATAADGMIKMAVVDARNTVQRAREIHNCSPTVSAALGRTLCAASLLGNAMKEEDATLTIRVSGDGPIAGIVAVSDSSGYVRGYAGNPRIDLPLRSDGKLNVGAAVGNNGTLTVSRDIGLKEPYIGSVALVSGEIAEDLTAYLTESEQIPSACALGVLVDTDTSIRAAGGFLVQLMPGAEETLIALLEENIFMMDQLTTILDEDGAEALFTQVLKGIDYHIVSREEIGYRCFCSRERALEAIGCIERSEIEEMIRAGEDIEVGCQFCDAKYVFTPQDLSQLLTVQ